jgi:hypothetical protein
MSKREKLREEQKNQKRIANVIAISAIVILFVIVGYFIWASVSKPASTPLTPAADTDLLGEAIPPGADRGHIADDSDPGPYSSNPPTSGHHYAKWLDAGFYDANTYKYPQAHLVHNLEHGYIVFWYNCKSLSDSQCSDLKAQIKAVMDAAQNFKVIAYPWDSIDVPLVLTAWGFRLPMPTFDAALASKFIEQHRNRGPEPGAP